MDAHTVPLINGQGTPESAWGAWDGIAHLPEIDVATLVPHGCRAVVLSPHPDDEILATGGLLAMLAAADRDILIIGVSDGGASHPGSSLWTPARLAELRRAESNAGLKSLGLKTPVLRLGLPDGELAGHRAELIAALDESVSASDVVFAPWRQDGHPDHDAAGEAAAAICARKRATLVEVPIWTWHWAKPADPRVPWQNAARLMLGAGVLEKKQAAIACHRSQLAADGSTGAMPVLPDWALDRWMRPYEVFFPS